MSTSTATSPIQLVCRTARKNNVQSCNHCRFVNDDLQLCTTSRSNSYLLGQELEKTSSSLMSEKTCRELELLFNKNPHVRWLLVQYVLSTLPSDISGNEDFMKNLQEELAALSNEE